MAGGEGEGLEEFSAVRGVGGGGAAVVVQAADGGEVLAVLEHLKRRLWRQLGPLQTSQLALNSAAQMTHRAAV